MTAKIGRRSLIILSFWTIFTGADCCAQGTLLVSPPAVALGNPEATQQVLVRSSKSPGDLTRLATYEVLDPKIATVDAAGLLQPKAEGRSVLVVRHGKEETRIPVATAKRRARTASSSVSSASILSPTMKR